MIKRQHTAATREKMRESAAEYSYITPTGIYHSRHDLLRAHPELTARQIFYRIDQARDGFGRIPRDTTIKNDDL